MNRHIILECSKDSIEHHLNRYDEDGYDLASCVQIQPAKCEMSEFDTKEWKSPAMFLLIFRRRD